MPEYWTLGGRCVGSGSGAGRCRRECSGTRCWWYTRKQEIATAVNTLGLRNLRAYLSLDPSSLYPSVSDYPFGITYLFGDGQRHPDHDRILSDRRLKAIFLLKRGGKVQDPDDERVLRHSKLCREKQIARAGGCIQEVCLTCRHRCNSGWKVTPKEDVADERSDALCSIRSRDRPAEWVRWPRAQGQPEIGIR